MRVDLAARTGVAGLVGLGVVVDDLLVMALTVPGKPDEVSELGGLLRRQLGVLVELAVLEREAALPVDVLVDVDRRRLDVRCTHDQLGLARIRNDHPGLVLSAHAAGAQPGSRRAGGAAHPDPRPMAVEA